MNADDTSKTPETGKAGQPSPVTIQNLSAAPTETALVTATPTASVAPSGIAATPGSAPVAPVTTRPAAKGTVDLGAVVTAAGADVPPKRNTLASYWKKVGGGSLMLSLLIHVGILAIAAVLVGTVVNKETPVDFLPGGGSKAGRDASATLAQKVQTKKRSQLNKSVPMHKVVSTSASAISLPDVPTDPIDMPTLSSTMGGGAMGSGGFGESGAGGGFGTGIGIGGMKGVTFKPIIMFGKDLKARKIGVIMDVSGSMTPHLTKVVKELDRVASGSRLLLYVGCGVASPKEGVRLDRDAIRTSSKSNQEDKNFEIFWRKSHNRTPTPNMPPPAPKKNKDDKDPIPEEEVYNVLANRQETYFMKSQGIQYAWISLLVRELRDADALYWFSDFQDAVDDAQLEAVLENLKRRKQKLFIHASVKGRSFEKIRDQLVIPTGGEVVDAK